MQELLDKIELSDVPHTIRMFLTVFVICLGFGYLLAILNIQIVEGLNYSGIVYHYRGNEAKMITAPEPGTISEISHTHMNAMTMMYFCLGIVFMFTKSLPEWLKEFVLVDSFVAVIIANASFWLIRFVAAPFAVLMMLSGMLLGISTFFEVTTVLYELWLKKPVWKWLNRKK
jgi:hypothetical protein